MPNCWLQDCDWNNNGYVCVFGEPWTLLNDCKLFFDRTQPLNLADQGIRVMGAGAVASAIPLDPVTSVLLINAVITSFESQGFTVPDNAILRANAATPYFPYIPYSYCLAVGQFDLHGCHIPDTDVLLTLRAGVPLAAGVAGAIIGALVGPIGAVIGAIAGVAIGIVVVAVVFAFAAVLEAVVCGYVNYYCDGKDITANLIGHPGLQRHPIPLELTGVLAALGVTDAPKYLGDIEGWGLPTFDPRDRSQVAHNATLIGSAGSNNVGASIMCAVGEEKDPLITFDGDIHADLSNFDIQGLNGAGMSVNSLMNLNNFRNGPGGTSPPDALLVEIPVADRQLFGQEKLQSIQPGSILRICGYWVVDTDSSELWLELHPVTSIDIVPYFTSAASPVCTQCVSPNWITVGGTGTISVSLTSHQGDASDVIVTSKISGGPAGTPPVLSPTTSVTLQPDGVVLTDLNVATSTATTPGIYTINVTATGPPELCTTKNGCFTPKSSSLVSFIIMLPPCDPSMTLPCYVNPPTYANSISGTLPAGSSLELQVNCNSGDVATGGGFGGAGVRLGTQTDEFTGDVDVVTLGSVTSSESKPVIDGAGRPVGWIARFSSSLASGSGPDTVTANVECMSGILASSQTPLVHTLSNTTSIAPLTASDVRVSCGAGDFATGGGFLYSSQNLAVFGSSPSPNSGKPVGWTASFANPDSVAHDGVAYVVCMTPPAAAHSLSTYIQSGSVMVPHWSVRCHLSGVSSDRHTVCTPPRPGSVGFPQSRSIACGSIADGPIPDYATAGGFLDFRVPNSIGASESLTTTGVAALSISSPLLPVTPFLQMRMSFENPNAITVGLGVPPSATIFAICMTPTQPFSAATVQHFSISATPADVTVLAGETASYTVTVSLLSSNATLSNIMPIPLSVTSGLPPGATAQFNPPSVVQTPNLRAILQLSTSPFDLGDYQVTIQGNSGGVTNSTTVNLHVYDYTIDSSPSDRTVLRGGSTSYTLNFTLVVGSSTIGLPSQSLTLSGQPSDSTPYAGSTSITPTQRGTLTTLTIVTAGPPNEPLGNYTLTISGRDPHGETRSASSSLHIYDFTLSLSHEETVLRGARGSYTITATLVNGSSFTSIPPVSLSPASGLPSDALTNISGPVTPSATGVASNLVIATGRGSLGDFSFTVAGTDARSPEGGTRQATGKLHIYDFTVTVSHDETVLRGGQGVYTATPVLAPGSSITGIPSIVFSVSAGLPSDASPAFGGNVPPTASGTSTSLTIVTGSTSLGDYTFTVIAADTRSPEGDARSGTGGLHIYDFGVVLSHNETVLRGGQGNYTVTATLAPGSSNSGIPALALRVPSGLPSDAAAAFSGTVRPTLTGATSNLIITTGSISLGDYSFTVAGIDGRSAEGGVRSGTGGLHLYDFTVTASPSSLRVLTTGSNTYDVNVGLVSGSTTVRLPSLTLTVSGLPPGAMGRFTMSSSIPSFATTLTIITTNVANSTYTLTVSGTDSRSPEGGLRQSGATLVVLSPQQALQLVINQVNALKSAGVLNNGQAGSLMSKLTQVVKSLNVRPADKETACNQLKALVNEINSYVTTGVLTQAQANSLLSGPLGINAVMATMPC